ncbi:MAG: hypothetical protein HGA97_12630 [Chlorobiaceae bacterium]|nr:hypothetical protein [Chlorobiaceae bacterium]
MQTSAYRLGYFAETKLNSNTKTKCYNTHKLKRKGYIARPASGKEVLATAKQALKTARTVEKLRLAQAVVLPQEYGIVAHYYDFELRKIRNKNSGD